MVSEELKKKKDEEASQIWAAISPSAEKCRTCINALDDTEFTVGAEKCYCKVFVAPDEKPTDVLWNGGDCRYYVEEI